MAAEYSFFDKNTEDVPLGYWELEKTTVWLKKISQLNFVCHTTMLSKENMRGKF